MNSFGYGMQDGQKNTTNFHNMNQLLIHLSNLDIFNVSEKDLHTYLKDNVTLNKKAITKDDIDELSLILNAKNYHILQKKYEGNNEIEKFFMKNWFYIEIFKTLMIITVFIRCLWPCKTSESKYLPPGSLVYANSSSRGDY